MNGSEAQKRMHMPPVDRMRRDEQAWRTATWAVPFIVQIVVALNFMILWLLGKASCFANEHERAWFLTGTAITVLVTSPIAGFLLRSHSSRVRGVALAIGASSAIMAIGAIVYGFWILRW